MKKIVLSMLAFAMVLGLNPNTAIASTIASTDQRFIVENKFVDKHLIFMFVSIIIVTLYTFYTSSFNMSRVDDFLIQMAEQTIQNNMDIFGNSPLQSVATIHISDIQVTGTAFITSTSEFNRIYELLSHHPSWILNEVLTRLIIISQFNLIIVGVITATTAYRNKDAAIENLLNNIFKNQVFIVFYFSVSLLLVTSIFGIGVGYFKYYQIRNTEEMYLIMSIYTTIESLWTPDMFYYLQALFGTLIHLLSYGFFGVFIGHLIKNTIIAIVGILYIVNYFFSLLILYPVSPFYFTPEISGYFIIMPRGLPALPGDNFILSLSMLALYLITILFLSNKLMIKHFKRGSNNIV
ncbi:MAG: hypothetical protein FWD96_00185 [Defluviitaleaceae bacterium]|nr:hypothetical protein [Defluviitaleaceae bacterium]